MQLALIGFGAILVTVYIVVATKFAPAPINEERTLSRPKATPPPPIITPTETGGEFGPHKADDDTETGGDTDTPRNPTREDAPAFASDLPTLTATTINLTNVPDDPDNLTMPAYEDDYTINGVMTRDGWVHLPGTLASAEHWVNLGPKAYKQLSEQDKAMQKALDAQMARAKSTAVPDWADFDPVVYFMNYNRLKKTDRLTKEEANFHRDRGAYVRSVYEKYKKGEWKVGLGYVNADTGLVDNTGDPEVTPVLDENNNSAQGREILKMFNSMINSPVDMVTQA